MNTLFQELIAKAKDVLATAHPTKCVTLQVLGALSPDDVQLLEAGLLLGEERLGNLADVICEHMSIVRDILDRLRLDLQDYSDYYLSSQESYERSDISDAWLAAFLARHSGPGGVHFLLHDEHLRWEPSSGEIMDFRIEGEDELDKFPSVVEGYIISKGFAFPSTVDLLETSAKDSWEHWQSLWTWF